jgi:transposase
MRMSIVAVPSLEQEQQRSVVRYREQLVRNWRRAEARGRALTLTQGVLAPAGCGGRFESSRSPLLRV